MDLSASLLAAGLTGPASAGTNAVRLQVSDLPRLGSMESLSAMMLHHAVGKPYHVRHGAGCYWLSGRYKGWLAGSVIQVWLVPSAFIN